MRVADASPLVLWPLPLDVRYIDGRNWELRSDFQFISPKEARYPSVVLPEGFVTDFASIPRIFWNLMEPTDREIGKAALIHDWYYRVRSLPVTRDAADEMLLQGMEALGAPWWRRHAVYRSVRLFGGKAWQPRLAVVRA
jgi:hypothetical protein